MPKPLDPLRPRSFYGRRKGRALSRRQENLLRQRLPELAIDLKPGEDTGLELATVFSRDASVCWLEIGFGKGEHLAWQAARHPEINFIGCEPFVNGVVGLLTRIDEQALSNVRIFPDEAQPLLAALPSGCLGRVFLLHPDPWPKYRHRGRRFVSAENLDLLQRLMATGAELRIGTDLDQYVDWTKEKMAGRKEFALLAEMTTDEAGIKGSGEWPQTRYEAKAERQGRAATRLIYRRQ